MFQSHPTFFFTQENNVIRRKTLTRTATAFALLCATSLATGHTSAIAQETIDTEHYQLRVERIAEVEHPWGIAFLPDGRFIVTERNANRMQIGNQEFGLITEIEGLPETFRYEGPTDRSQAGLFHVALHPDYADNQWVYFSFSEPSAEGTGTAIARGRLVEDGDTARLEGVETIYTMNLHDSSGLHFGGRFAFDTRDNTIVLSVGERRNISRSQDGEDHAGSFIRVADDGSVPDDNPYLDDDDVDDMIFSMGHRNSQGLAFHPETYELWANEHGPLAGDEVNLVEGGKNYGWPFQTGGRDYSGAPVGEGASVEGYEDAVHIWEDTVAPSGLTFYTGEMFPEWQGDMLHGGLVSRNVIRMRVEDGEVVEQEEMLGDLDRRIRDVAVADDGALWVLTEHEDGEVLRITRDE
jgi:aldose sugar dehydrogenase